MNTQLRSRSIGDKWTDTVRGHNWKQLQTGNTEGFCHKIARSLWKSLNLYKRYNFAYR